MSYRFKGNKIILNAEELCVTPRPLPSTPDDGCLTVDQADNKLKVWNGSRWIILGDAVDISFDNGVAQLDGNPDNVQAAIEALALSNNKTFYAQFQIIDDINFDEYIYSFFDSTGGGQERSGDRSNGYEFSNSSPIICPFDGKVESGVFAIKGIAVSTGNVAPNVTVNLELWKVGFQGEGSKLGDIDIDANSSQFTIGNWWNSSIDTDFSGSNNYNIDVSKGDLLAVKFIRQQNNSNAVEVKNLTVVLEIKAI